MHRKEGIMAKIVKKSLCQCRKKKPKIIVQEELLETGQKVNHALNSSSVQMPLNAEEMEEDQGSNTKIRNLEDSDATKNESPLKEPITMININSPLQIE